MDPIDTLAPAAAGARAHRGELGERERRALWRYAIGSGIAATNLAPLARSPSLRTVAVAVSVERGVARPSEAALQRAAGERIRLRLRETEFTVKR